MSEEIDDAATGGESESASSSLQSVIADAVAAQKAPQDEAPKEAAAPVAEGETEEKPPREDGRDEKGRFAPKEPKEPEVKAAEAEEDPAPEEKKPEYVRAPHGWSVAAKAAYGELPESVKEAIAKREEEVSQGFARYGGLKQYAEIAERNGTTLAQAVNDYAKIEDGLRRDFVSGIDAINARFGINPVKFIQAYAARHGVDFTGQQTAQAGYQPPHVDPDAIIQRATAVVEEKFAQREAAVAARESQTAIEQFKNDPQNQYFENVREDMAILLQTGKAKDLQEAYDRACWMNPEIRAVLLKSQNTNATPSNVAAVQKAKAAAKAVGGAPSPGFNPGTKHVDTSKMSIMDNIKHAIALQR